MHSSASNKFRHPAVWLAWGFVIVGIYNVTEVLFFWVGLQITTFPSGPYVRFFTGGGLIWLGVLALTVIRSTQSEQSGKPPSSIRLEYRRPALIYFCAFFLVLQYLLTLNRFYQSDASLLAVLPVTFVILVPALLMIWFELRAENGGRILAMVYYGFCALGSFMTAMGDGVEGPIRYSDFQCDLMYVLAALLFLTMCLFVCDRYREDGESANGDRHQ